MLPTQQSNIDRFDDFTPEDSNHSFHDLLLNRSKDCLRSHRREEDPWSPNYQFWVDQGLRFLQFAAECAIFVGGTAVGAGLVLLRRGEEFQGRPGLLVAIGLGFVTLSILARISVRPHDSRLSHATRRA